MGDLVMPVLVRPAVIGWKGRDRKIDLTIEREFSGPELVKRMKGWITVNPSKALEIFEKHGRLKCFETGELVVEVEDAGELSALEEELRTEFGDRCLLDPMSKPGNPAPEKSF
jgi:hypothetical protein